MFSCRRTASVLVILRRMLVCKYCCNTRDDDGRKGTSNEHFVGLNCSSEAPLCGQKHRLQTAIASVLLVCKLFVVVKALKTKLSIKKTTLVL